MIFRRVAANLRAQNWIAILIEFAIVVVGVFVGTWVANLNQQRIEANDTRQILHNLKPELVSNIETFDNLQHYYAVTRRWADTAYAGWRGDPGVSDRAFVIAAYQASQNTYTGINNSSWSEAFGSDQLRMVADEGLRSDLGLLMATDFIVLEQELFTDYRRNVREVIPANIQEAIRVRCGDRRFGRTGNVRLPTSCTLPIGDADFAVAARALRGQPELVGQMNWHFAAIASYVDNIRNLDVISKRALAAIDRSR